MMLAMRPMKSRLFSLQAYRALESTFVSTYNCRHRLLCSKAAENEHERKQGSATRKSPLHIQMLSESLYEQIFREPSSTLPEMSKNDTIKIQKHLERFDLWNKQTTTVPDVEFKLPKLQGENLDEHFKNIALKQSKPFKNLAEELANFNLPPKPKEWIFREGWTRYDPDGTFTEVAYPEDDGLVFDVEVLMKTKYFPTMAAAASPNAWYSWCSNRLIKDCKVIDKVRLSDMIPMESSEDQHHPLNGAWKPKLVIGHNVGFDRSFIKEQYYIKGTRMRFLDTMSMHIALRGMTGDQRMLFMARTKGSLRKEVREMEERAAKYREDMVFKWTEESSMNNLNDVYQLYCKAEPLEKAKRNVFMVGNIHDVRDQFQELMAYCAQDVNATHQVFQSLWPSLKERFPHPVTLAGMLEMGTTYLPVNSNWFEYISRANETYHKLQQEVTDTLMSVADEACKMLDDESYKDDPWLWDEDWSVRHFKRKKIPPKKLKQLEEEVKDPKERQKLIDQFSMPKRPVHMPGKPRWYAGLCPRESELEDYPERNRPCKLSTQRRITHKLLRLMWEGYPMHYDQKHGWGYLVPGKEISEIDLELMRQDFDGKILPYKQVYAVCQPVLDKLLKEAEIPDHEMKIILERDLGMDEELWQVWQNIPRNTKKKRRKKADRSKIEGPWYMYHKGDGPYDIDTPGCYFYRLPRGDSDDRNVSNPLSKHFLNRVEEEVLTSYSGSNANRVLLINMNCSYWKNSMERIGSQLVVRLTDDQIPDTIRRNPHYSDDMLVGAILPRLVVAGTVTRRAVEATWLTASNAYPNRVGSELKGMIQTPPGYHFVGADVDSQELWIAALLGDAAFAGQHGCTALGWMTLQGNKGEGTDLHSKTAGLIGISRDQAKVFNYGRIYGAGQRFAQKLLRDFNHRITKEEASSKARTLYLETKGKRYMEDVISNDETSRVSVWKGGSESYMFNQLEAIAKSNEPRTPVLGCRITQVLEPENVSTMFMTSRINWVVQSSAVDYLHLMLVSMRWLLEEYNIDGRFCISIHDEVRYLVNSEDRYRAALALQITNLLTRCMFVYKLKFHDLPQCVAFFSGVDIDTCLRKETHLDCKTPSNPAGIRTTYNISKGETLDIYSILEKTNSSLDKEYQQNPDQLEQSMDDLDALDMFM